MTGIFTPTNLDSTIDSILLSAAFHQIDCTPEMSPLLILACAPLFLLPCHASSNIPTVVPRAPQDDSPWNPDLSGDITAQTPVIPEGDDDSDFCLTGEWYTTERHGESCDDIAWARTTSSGSLFLTNQGRIVSCSDQDPIPAGTRLCLPPSCESTYRLEDEDSCRSPQWHNHTLDLTPDDVARYNPWVGYTCKEIQSTRNRYGSVICLGPLLGDHVINIGVVVAGIFYRQSVSGYSSEVVDPPRDMPLAEGTTPYCGIWHVSEKGDSCAGICMRYAVTADTFMEVNPSLGTEYGGCSGRLQEERVYCAQPHHDWENYGHEDDEEDWDEQDEEDAEKEL